MRFGRSDIPRRFVDPLISHSIATFPEGDSDERNDERRDQSLDSSPQIGAGL